jgi:hypothetical protein
MKTVIEEAFANMDDDLEDIEDQEIRAKVEVNNLINEVVNEINLGKLGADIMGSRMEKLHKQHAEEIREYKTMIFDLKNQVATLRMGRLAVQVVHQLHQQTLTFSLCKQRGTQL